MKTMMANSDRKAKRKEILPTVKLNFLLGRLKQKKKILFGGHSVGITNGKKALEWQHVADAVTAAGSKGRILSEIKKKWCDIKVECLCHWQGKGGHRSSAPFMSDLQELSGNPS